MASRVVEPRIQNEIVKDIELTLTTESYSDWVFFKRNKDDILRVKHVSENGDKEYIVMIGIGAGANG